MISFLPIAILGYALSGGTTLIDKILLDRSILHPVVYTFYIALLGFGTVILIPFGLILNPQIIFYAAVSGITGTLGTFTYFQSLKQGEASVVTPIIGVLNPVFTIILGLFFLNQVLNGGQIQAFLVLIVGTLILTFNLLRKVKFNAQLPTMVLSGFLYAVAYLFLKEVFIQSNFVTGLTLTRLTGGIFALTFLIPLTLRKEILASKLSKHHFVNKTSYLMFFGQLMGAVGGILITYAVSLAHPALVNSLFGVQYLVILVAALILFERHSHILGENLSKPVLAQKVLGVIVLSFGLYLLT